MNIMLIADLKNSEIIKMIHDIPDINWITEKNNIAKGELKTDFQLYVISPDREQQIPKCIPKLIEDSNKRSKYTLFCFLTKNDDQLFSLHQIKSLNAIGQMVRDNGSNWLQYLPTTLSDFQKKFDIRSIQ